jgi:hypothetical protein
MTTQLTLILPSVLPPSDTRDTLGVDLLKQLELPSLQKLLLQHESPGADADEQHHDAYLPTLPHERWLSQAAEIPPSGTGLPTAPYMRLAARERAASTHGVATASSLGKWACLQPVHIHAARDHLVLLDPAQLDIQADEADALYQAIEPLLEEHSLTLERSLPDLWFVAGEPFGALNAATPARTIGRNIDLWMQSGERARDWRRFQNEVQMIWFDHPVNQSRESRGRVPINSVWLHGMGSEEPVAALADEVWSDDLFTRGLALAAGTPIQSPPEMFKIHSTSPDHILVLLDQASRPYANGDWATWLSTLQHLETHWFAPILVALRQGHLSKLRLVVSSDTHFATRVITRSGLRKFWRGMRVDWRQRWLALGGDV